MKDIRNKTVNVGKIHKSIFNMSRLSETMDGASEWSLHLSLISLAIAVVLPDQFQVRKCYKSRVRVCWEQRFDCMISSVELTVPAPVNVSLHIVQ